MPYRSPLSTSSSTNTSSDGYTSDEDFDKGCSHKSTKNYDDDDDDKYDNSLSFIESGYGRDIGPIEPTAAVVPSSTEREEKIRKNERNGITKTKMKRIRGNFGPFQSRREKISYDGVSMTVTAAEITSAPKTKKKKRTRLTNVVFLTTRKGLFPPSRSRRV